MSRKFLFLSAALLTSCAVGPDYQPPDVPVPPAWPGQHSAADGKPATTALEKSGEKKDDFTVPRQWWQGFNDPVLTKLIEEGTKNNSDLLIAAGRVAEARGLLTSARANLYPEIDIQGDAERVKQSADESFGGFTITSSKPYNDFALSAVLNYELDLWGRLRRADEAARAELLSLKANRDAVRLAVASDISTGYFNLRALDAEIIVTQNTIKSRAENYKYLDAQYKYGAATGLDYKQAEAELAAAKADLPVLQQAREEQETALAVLMGRTPKDLVEMKIENSKDIDALPTPPDIPADLPSTLLRRRPDIKAAEQELKANNANIGVAIGDYFPKISLAAMFGVDSSKLNTMFDSSARAWQFGANLAGPLLDFGRVTGNVEAARARKDQAFASYMQTVRNAFKDVLDALNRQQTTKERIAQQTIQVNARAEALRLANLRYNSGYSDYLTVLDDERFLYQAQIDRVTAKRDSLIAAVNLYKALGGGWGTKEKVAEPQANTTPVDSRTEVNQKTAPSQLNSDYPRATK